MAVDLSTYWKNYDPETGVGDPSTPLAAQTLNEWGAGVEQIRADAENFRNQAWEAAEQAQAPTDGQMAAALSTPGSASRTAADELYADPVGVDSARYVTPDTAADVSTDLAAAVTAAGAHPSKTLTLRPGEYLIATPVDVPDNVTIRGLTGATLVTSGDTHIFNAASGTTFENLLIRGTNTVGGTATLTAQYGINAVGTGGARLSDITIRGCRFEGIEYAAVRIRHTDRFRVESCTFLDTGYSAVQIGCAADGIVAGNFFRGTGVLPSYAVNSYAVSMSLDSGPIDPVTNPQPTRITVSNNIVTSQAWEALDTHGGTEIEFSGNIIVGCEMGIAVTWRTGTAGSGPQRVVVTGNVVNGEGYPDGAVRAGMSINGAGDGSSDATAIIVGNYVANHGVSKDHPAQWNPRSGGIVASWCDSITVANNTLDTIRGAGISFRRCTTVNAAGNVFRGVWREAGDDSRLSSCVYLDDAAAVTLTGNAIRFHTGGKPNANERAIYVVPGTTNNVVDLGNNWGARLHENLPRLSQGRGSFNDGIDLGGSTRVTGSTPSQPDGAVKANTAPSWYPAGESHWNATSSGTNGWPFNGLLINRNYTARTVQTIYESSTTAPRIAVRVSTDGAAWGSWRIFTGA